MKTKTLLNLSIHSLFKKDNVDPPVGPQVWFNAFPGVKSVIRYGLMFLIIVSSSAALAQNIVINGTVKDTQGAALIGVSVTIKGTTFGTSTNVDGKYKINVNDNKAILVFKHIGFVTIEKTVN